MGQHSPRLTFPPAVTTTRATSNSTSRPVSPTHSARSRLQPGASSSPAPRSRPNTTAAGWTRSGRGNSAGSGRCRGTGKGTTRRGERAGAAAVGVVGGGSPRVRVRRTLPPVDVRGRGVEDMGCHPTNSTGKIKSDYYVLFLLN